MRRLFIVFCMKMFLAVGPVAVFANIDNLSNMSVEWMRTCNRNAATDSTDIVMYNPAGLTALSEGFHASFGNQTMNRVPTHRFDLGLGAGEKEFEQESPDWFLPNLYAAYRKNNWAVFGGFYIPGGGAVVDYPDGSINTQFIGSMTVLSSGGAFTGFHSDHLEASSMYSTMTFGVAYAVNEQIALAAGFRYINAVNEIDAGASFNDAWGNTHVYKLDYEEYADGVGGILGLELFPSENMNIGIRYESRVKLNFETELNRNDFPKEFRLADYKAKNRRDFPATFGIGAAWRPTTELTAELDFSWYFQKEADWGKSASGRDLADVAGDAWSSGVSLSYQATPNLLVSGGAIFTKFMFDDMAEYYRTIGAFEVLYSDNWNVGAGFAWELWENIRLNAACGWTIWEKETIEFKNAEVLGQGTVWVETENSTLSFSTGFDVAF